MINPLSPFIAPHAQCVESGTINEETLSTQDKVPDASGEVKDTLSESAFTKEPKEWTLLFYMDGNNDLYKWLEKSMIDMEKVGSDANVDVVSQVGFRSMPMVFPPWSGVRRFHVEKGSSPDKVSSPVLEDLGDRDMSNPGTLADFVSWGMKKYPAKHYALVIMNHGFGFRGTCLELNWGKESIMSLPELEKSLEAAETHTGMKPELIVFDSCLMGETEVAYQIKDNAKIMLSSQEITFDSYPYSSYISQLQEKARQKELPPEELAGVIFDAHSSDGKGYPSFAAIDLEKIGALAEETDRFARHLMEGAEDKEVIKDTIARSEHFSGPAVIDQYDFCQRLLEDPRIKSEQTKDSCRKVMDLIKETVMAESHVNEGEYAHPRAHGLSIHAPARSDAYKEEYLETDFARSTQWDEFLDYFIS